MRYKYIEGILAVSLLITVNSGSAGLNDWMDIVKDRVTGPDTAATQTGALALSQSEIAEGLKQALDQGVQHAVTQLGQPGGFLDDARVRIPMPDQLVWAEKTLRTLGQNQLADEFVQSMNRAAEQAVPEVTSVFGDAIRDMSLQDARRILDGPEDAATSYFRDTSSDALTKRISPIVSKATSSTGVTSSYKSMMGKAGGISSLLGTDSVDLDSYVTQKAMDGLFLMIAEQEKLIRENPLQRSTDILQKVFGAVAE